MRESRISFHLRTCGADLVVGDVLLALVEVAAALRVGEVAPGLRAAPGVRVGRGLLLVVNKSEQTADLK